MFPLQISLFGSFRVFLDNQPITNFATTKVQALLAYLLLESDQAHDRSTLAGLFWPEQSEEAARASLRQALYLLRQAVQDQNRPQPFFEFNRNAITFNRHRDHWLDVATFTNLVQQCQKHAHSDLGQCESCCRRLEEAIALYQGDFLAQLSLPDSAAFENWAVARREWLRQRMVEALQGVAAFYEYRQQIEIAQRYARRQVEFEPLQEDGYLRLMRLLATDGQRGAALALYEKLRTLLAQEMRVSPSSQMNELVQQIRQGYQVPAGTPNPLSLPKMTPPLALTSLIGRDLELQKLVELLQEPACRLLSLIGPGGVGKSELALWLGGEMMPHFQHGVCFVSLAGVKLADDCLLLLARRFQLLVTDPAVAKTALLNTLQSRHLLLLLDDVDQLNPQASFLLEILQQAAQVKIVVTAHGRLNLPGEWAFCLDGLPLPSGREEPAADYGAAQLFWQQARQANSRFQPTADDWKAIHRICRMVEGNPLGISLAASWVRVISCQAIAAEMENNPHFLTVTPQFGVPAHHHGLTALFANTWQRLTAAQQQLLTRLAIFRDGFTFPAGQNILKLSLTDLAMLIDQSLIGRAGPERYKLPELLHQFAAEKLSEQPPLQRDLRLKHGHYYATFLAEQLALLRGPAQHEALTHIAHELDNVRQAWRWAVGQNAAYLLTEALPGLFHFYDMSGRFEEGEQLFRDAAPRFLSQDKPLGGLLLVYQGWLAFQQQRLEEAQQLIRDGTYLVWQSERVAEAPLPLVYLAAVTLAVGDYSEVHRFLQHGLNLSKQYNDWFAATFALQVGGDLARLEGRFGDARRLYEQSLNLKQVVNERWGMAFCWVGLGNLAYTAGHYAESRGFYENGLRLWRETGDLRRAAGSLGQLAQAALMMADLEGAGRFAEQGLAIYRTFDDPAGQLLAHRQLFQVARGQHRPAEAIQQLQQALTIAVSRRLSRQASEILIEISQLLNDLKKKGQPFDLNSLPAPTHPLAADLLAQILPAISQTDLTHTIHTLITYLFASPTPQLSDIQL